MLSGLLLAAALAPSAGALTPSTATLAGVDFYRSTRLDYAKVARVLGVRPGAYVQFLNEGAPDRAEKLRQEMEAAVARLGDFAYLSLHAGRHVSASAYDIVLTFDVVDRADASLRMPWRPAPAGRLPDPGGLLTQWGRYAQLCADMRRRGEMVFARPACPAFYCPAVERTDAVLGFERAFAEAVPASVPVLAEVLAGDSEAPRRAAAAYLLSYSTDARGLVGYLLDAVTDQDIEVRSAALTVLAEVASSTSSAFLEPGRILLALDFPATGDRNRALAVLAGLAASPSYQPYLASRAAVQLARLLRSLDPGVNDLAYVILGMISKKDLQPLDFEAWDQWAVAASSGVVRDARDGSR